MRFPAVIAALLTSMLLQAVSLGGHWAGNGNPADALHAVLHWSGVLHHHDHEVTQAELDAGGERARVALQAKLPALALPAAEADDAGFEAFAEEFAQVTLHPGQSYHQDHSLDSRHHLSIDACFGAVALIPSVPGSPLMALETAPPVAGPETEPADPFLNGPRRPPRSLA